MYNTRVDGGFMAYQLNFLEEEKSDLDYLKDDVKEVKESKSVKFTEELMVLK